MNKIEITQLPYVNGLPDEGQNRINWIKNGEDLTGASTKYGVDGNLNRGANQVQDNVVVIDKNVQKIADTSNEMISQIETINSILAVSENTEALAQIGKNTNDIGLLKTSIETIEEGTSDLDTRVSFIEEDLGTYNPAVDTFYRPVRNDLYWIKKEMGQYPGQDINGQSASGNDATGMKRRIIDNSAAINNNIERIVKLEKSFSDSDVGSLTVEVKNLRSELGPKPSSTVDPVYTRLTRMNTSISGMLVSMEDIMDSIGLNSGVPSLISLVNENSSSINSINLKLSNSSTGLIPRVESIEGQIGVQSAPTSINGRIKLNTDSINSLSQIVGADTSSGLRGQVAWINQIVGIVQQGTEPPSTSLIFRMDAIEGQQQSVNDSIQEFQIEIGNNNNEGLKGQVLRLNTVINGTDPNGSTVEQRGILNTTKSNELKINQLASDIQNLIPEAPMDGKAYVRQNGAWVDISTLTP